MEFQDIIFSKEGHIATITLNRPDRLNALSSAMVDSLQRAVRDANDDPEIRVIIITGAGRGFCSGGDVKAMAEGQVPRLGGVAERGGAIGVPFTLLNIDKPLIAMVNGPAAGWGCDLVALCDIKIASDRAVFGELFVKRGLIPDGGGTWTLPRLLGWSKACEMVLLGDIIDAKEAERIGLVNRVVPHDDLEKVTTEIATKISNNAPLAVKAAKRLMRLGLRSDLETALDQVAFSQNNLLQSEDHKEGARAFVEKREPVFKGQ